MEFTYYVVSKNNQTILYGAQDMMSAIGFANQANCACYILQGCILTEVGQDPQQLEIVESNEDKE